MGVDNWSTTPADNALQDNIDWSEGMSPAKVNDSAREMMAQIARNILDRSGALTSTGSAGVFALATNTGITQLKAGLRFTFKANVASVGGDTLNVDAKGAKKLRVVDDDGERDIAEDEIDAGGFYDVVYDPDGNSSAGAWIVQNADFTAITADIVSVQSSLNTHKADTGNPHCVTKAQVGLGNADNTSDADKPISTAQNTAITARLYKASNLSDLPSKATARGNLSVPSIDDLAAALTDYYTKVAADASFLGIGATAADSNKLGGQLASYFAAAANYFDKTTSDGRYLGKTAKAADSDKLDGKHASAFALVADQYSPYTGSDKDNLDFPIGTILNLVGLIERNTTLVPRVGDADNYNYTTSSSKAALLGTWKSRGVVGTGTLIERIY